MERPGLAEGNGGFVGSMRSSSRLGAGIIGAGGVRHIQALRGGGVGRAQRELLAEGVDGRAVLAPGEGPRTLAVEFLRIAGGRRRRII